jgi:hypothetical protein
MKQILKSILIASLILVSGISQANPNFRHHHGHRGHAPNVDWIVPLVIGGVVVHAITQPRAQPIIIHQSPNIQPQPAPYGYHYENILDANCNCYRLVLVQNQP